MQKEKLDLLILDYDLYPRGSAPDSQHIGYMLDSIVAGIELPPVIVDKKSKRVVDGFHRVKAWHRYFNSHKDEDKTIPSYFNSHKDEDKTIPIIYKSYRSEGDMFIDAMKYNSAHGRTLTQYDRAHCIIKAEEVFHLSIDVVSKALSITVSKYDKLKTDRIGSLTHSPHLKSVDKKRKPAIIKSDDKQLSGKLVSLKRTIRHKAGQEITEQQAEINKKLNGADPKFTANQLIMLIENDLLDENDYDLIEKLNSLYSLLNSFLSKKKISKVV